MVTKKSTGSKKSDEVGGPLSPILPGDRSLEDQGYMRSYRRIVMYEDLNAAGSIFGGQLVGWIDEASAIFASCQTNSGRVVTKKISELIFDQPARLGDVLEIWCKVLKAGTTSITLSAIVMRRSFADDKQVSTMNSAQICNCQLVFVVLDEHGKPKAWA